MRSYASARSGVFRTHSRPHSRNLIPFRNSGPRPNWANSWECGSRSRSDPGAVPAGPPPLGRRGCVAWQSGEGPAALMFSEAVGNDGPAAIRRELNHESIIPNAAATMVPAQRRPSALRSVDALLFGTLADRYGRRRPLLAVVTYFSVIEVLSGFAPNCPIFLCCACSMASGWE